MNPAMALPAWAVVATSVLVLIGAGLTFIGTLGLLRFRTFYQRVHAPTLGSTLGTGFVLFASMLCFSVLGSRVVMHEILIAIFMTVTTPVTLVLLVRSALSRDIQEGRIDIELIDGGKDTPAREQAGG